ncbi:MAG: hypothetical protein WCL50_03140 [Spirochaetota bacterium]
MQHTQLRFPVLAAFSFLLALTALSAGAEPVAPDQPYPKITKSIDVGLVLSYPYSGSLKDFGPSYLPSLALGYSLTPDYQLAIVLLRFNHYFAAADKNGKFGFAYGFQFKHFLPRAWADLGAWQPWLAYGIFLNQLINTSVSGRGNGHNTHLAMGSDLALDSRNHLVFEADWDMSTFPAFGTTTEEKISSVSAGIGYRFLY